MDLNNNTQNRTSFSYTPTITFLKEIATPLTLIILISQFFFGASWLLTTIDNYRLARWQTNTQTHVEQQLLHVENQTRHLSTMPKMVFIGSSSVVNGLDAGLITSELKYMGQNIEVSNFGMTNLIALELIGLEKLIIKANPKTIVYLYNSFSFADKFHPQAVNTRLDYLSGDLLIHEKNFNEIKLVLNGAVSSAFYLTKYRNAYRAFIQNSWHGTLLANLYPYDYPVSEQYTIAHIPKVSEPAMPESHWLRAAYLDSSFKPNSKGYKALAAFLVSLKQKGYNIIVAPVPEAQFADLNRYAKGVEKYTIDKKVKEITQIVGATFIGREHIQDIEAQQGLFRDLVHLNAWGRKVYSERLVSLMNGEGSI